MRSSQIKIARISLGWTQKDLANCLKVDVGTISRLENMKPVYRSTFERACDALNVDPAAAMHEVVIADRSASSARG